jgi:hypothetical protein
MSTSSDARNPVELLAEEFLDRKRRGEQPTLREYLERHPELARESAKAAWARSESRPSRKEPRFPRHRRARDRPVRFSPPSKPSPARHPLDG